MHLSFITRHVVTPRSHRIRLPLPLTILATSYLRGCSYSRPGLSFHPVLEYTRVLHRFRLRLARHHR
jgi:hypothetical protein